ncbi:MAG: YfhO family protein [Bacteroidetes bacterium]|nr:YfhO family protein [Bacteroidota bacterium]
MTVRIKNIFPHLIALSVFIILTAVQYYPVLQGKVIRQNDVLNYRGTAKESEDYFVRTGKWPLWTNSMFCGMPAYQVAARYPSNLLQYIYRTLTRGFGVGNFTLIALIGFYVLLLSFNVHWLLSMGGAIAYAFSAYFFIIIQVGHNSKTMALALLPMVVAGVIHLYNNRYLTGAILTGIFMGLLFIANHIQMTYYMFMCLGIFISIKFILSLKENRILKFFKSSYLFLFMIILALLSSITLLWMTYEYGKHSTRGESELTLKNNVKTTGLDKDYALRWSYGISETLNLLIPDFSGGKSEYDIGTKTGLYKYFYNANRNTARQLVKKTPTYWGTQPFTDGPFYLGSITCFLFIMGIFMVKGPFKWWLAGSALLAILLSWGKNFSFLSDLFFDYVPFYNKFRAVSSILVIAMFAVPLLAFLCLSEFFAVTRSPGKGAVTNRKKEKGDTGKFAPVKKALLYAFLITGGIILFILVFGKGLFDFTGLRDEEYRSKQWPIDLIKAERISMMRSDCGRSLLFIALAAAALYAFLKNRLKKEIALIGIIGLVLIDQWSAGRRYLNSDNFVRTGDKEYSIKPAHAELQILNQEILYNSRIPHFARTLAPNYLEWKKTDYPGQDVKLNEDDSVMLRFMAMGKLTDFRVLNVTTQTFSESRTSYFFKSLGGYHGAKLERYQELIEYQISKNNSAVWNMLNAKYFIAKGADNNPVAQLNQGAMGPAWFVMNYRIVANADSELTALNTFNPAVTAFADQRFTKYLEELSVQYDPENTLVLNDYDLERLQYTSRAKTEQLAVFSEIYYDDGWNAYLDGNPVPHIRVNYVLRGLRVPAGEHKIEFRFEPANYYRCEKISFTSSLTLLVICLGGIAVHINRTYGRTSNH